MTSLLLLYGADIKRSCNSFCCALFYAIWKNRPEIARLLLEEYGASSSIPIGSPRISTALHILVVSKLTDTYIIDLLFNSGIDLDANDTSGWVALHCAAMEGNKAVAKKLIESGANKGLRTNKGHTALDIARSFEQNEVRRLLGDKRSWL